MEIVLVIRLLGSCPGRACDAELIRQWLAAEVADLGGVDIERHSPANSLRTTYRIAAVSALPEPPYPYPYREGGSDA